MVTGRYNCRDCKALLVRIFEEIQDIVADDDAGFALENIGHAHVGWVGEI